MPASRFGNIDLLADMRADRDKYRVEASLLFLGKNVFDTMVQCDLHTEVFDTIDLRL